MPSWKKCVFGCKDSRPLFSLPRNESVRQKWLAFFYGDDPPPKKTCFVCAKHFTDDSFLNKSSYDSGLLTKLSLKDSAVPTLKSAAFKPAPRPPSPGSGHWVEPQTARSAGASRKELRKGIQVDRISRGAAPHVKPTSGVGGRPRKRPRLEMEEEEEETDWSFSSDRCELSEMETPEFEDVKYIVFESALRELFDACPVCTRHCVVEQRRCGTSVAFIQNCPHCCFARTWQSQPVKCEIPQGDLELSAAVYFNGGSFTKIQQICNTMNLKVHQYETFRRHARNLLEPAIYHKWKKDQSKVLEEMNNKGKVAVSGDMRADSPGQSDRFGSYTIMENDDKKILDVQLVQSSDVGSSVNMEQEGLKRSLDLLESSSVRLDHIVTDGRPQVQKHLRDREIPHSCAVGQVVKGLSQRLGALARNQDCDLVQKWLPAIKNHMYWTACSSKSGPEKVAKWTSLVNHIQNVHKHKDPLFPQCEHPVPAPRGRSQWLQPGSAALYKVKKMLLNKRILKDVRQLSSKPHKPALESFHRLTLHFTPKNVNVPFTGKLCRLYLAAMHHNEMVQAKGKPVWKLVLPGSKGRATARTIRTDATFGYRRDLMQLLFNEVLCDPQRFQRELQTGTAPPSSMWDDVVAVQVS